MKLDIRKAHQVDATALAEILTQATQFKLAHHDTAWGSKPYTTQELRTRIAKGGTHAAWLDKTLVATLILLGEDKMMWGEQPPVAMYVHQLAVKDGYHGRGIGEQLLDWARQQAADQKRHFLRIDCPPDNDSLRAYYEKHGFQWVMDREIHAPHSAYTAALYQRPV